MAKKICRNCGYFGRPKKSSSFIGEIAVWILFIIVAIIFMWTIFVPIICISICISYTFYRFFSGTKSICPSCKATNTMVPIDTPIGKDLYNKYYSTEKN